MWNTIFFKQITLNGDWSFHFCLALTARKLSVFYDALRNTP